MKKNKCVELKHMDGGGRIQYINVMWLDLLAIKVSWDSAIGRMWTDMNSRIMNQVFWVSNN